MQKCVNCKEQFSWGKIYKSNWWNYKPIKCNECGREHVVTIFGRLTYVSLTIIPMLIFGYFLSPFSNVFVTLGIAILIFKVGSLLTPFFVSYE